MLNIFFRENVLAIIVLIWLQLGPSGLREVQSSKKIFFSNLFIISPFPWNTSFRRINLLKFFFCPQLLKEKIGGYWIYSTLTLVILCTNRFLHEETLKIGFNLTGRDLKHLKAYQKAEKLNTTLLEIFEKARLKSDIFIKNVSLIKQGYILGSISEEFSYESSPKSNREDWNTLFHPLFGWCHHFEPNFKRNISPNKGSFSWKQLLFLTQNRRNNLLV